MDFFDMSSGKQDGRHNGYSATHSPHTDDLAVQSSRAAAPPSPMFHFQQPPSNHHYNQPSSPTPSVNPISSFISPDSIKGAIGKIEALKAANQQLTSQKEALSTELCSVRQTCATLKRSLAELQGDNTLLGARVSRWQEYTEGYLTPILAAYQEVRKKHYHALRAKIRSVDTKFQTAKKELLHEVEEERQKSAEATQLMLKGLLKEKDAFIADLQRRNASLTSELAASFMTMGTPASSSGGGGGGRSASGATTPIRSASSAFPSSSAGRIASSSATSSRAQPPPHHHSTTPPQPNRGTPRGAFSLPVGVGVDSSHQPHSRPSHSNNGSFAIGHEAIAASPNSARQITSPTRVSAPSSSTHHHHINNNNNLGASSSNLAASTTAGEFRLSRRPSDIKHEGGADVSARHGGSHSLLESAMMVAASPSPIRVVDDRPNDSSRWGADVQLSPSTARIMERLSMAPPR